MKLDKAIEVINHYVYSHDLTPLQKDALETIINELKEKDTFGIKNVNFSIIDKSSSRWDDFKSQRLNNGFDESECWNLDKTICEFIAPRLKYFRNKTESYPSSLTEESWKEILDKMIKFFKNYKECTCIPSQSEGFDLFVKYFDNLWW